MPAREGIGFYVWNLARHLTWQGHQVQIITRGGRALRREQVDGVVVWHAPFAPLYPFHVHVHGIFVNRLVRQLEREVDLFHVHSPLPPAVQTSRPVMVTFHSAVRHDVNATRVNSVYTAQMKLQAPVSYRIEQRLLRQAKTVTAVSPQVVDGLSMYPDAPKHVQTTWNGVDTTLFRPPGDDARDERLVITVGRLAPGKGMEDVLQAARHVCQRIGSARFLVVGDGLLRQRLEAYIAQHNLEQNVTLLGHVADRARLAELYRQAAVFALLSHHEGLPTVMLEAMACGCAVVATDVGGIPYVVEQGKSGELVPVGMPARAADTICNLLESPRQRHAIGQQARRTVEQRFSWTTVGQDYLSRYHTLLGGQG